MSSTRSIHALATTIEALNEAATAPDGSEASASRAALASIFATFRRVGSAVRWTSQLAKTAGAEQRLVADSHDGHGIPVPHEDATYQLAPPANAGRWPWQLLEAEVAEPVVEDVSGIEELLELAAVDGAGPKDLPSAIGRQAGAPRRRRGRPPRRLCRAAAA